MREVFNAAILLVTLLVVTLTVVLFGGVLLQYLVPVYVLLAILLLLWIAKLVLIKRVSWITTPLHGLVFAFVIYAAVRYLTSPIEYPSRIELLTILACAAVYFTASFNLHRTRDRLIGLSVLLALAFGQAVYGLIQFATGTQSWLWLQREDYLDRAGGTFYNANHLAAFFEMLLPLFLAQLMVNRSPSLRSQTNFIWRLLLLYVGVFALAGLYATGSRGGWLGTTCGMLAVIIGAWRAREVAPRAVDVALGVFLAIVIAGFAYSDIGVRWRDTLRFNPDYRLGELPIALQNTDAGGRQRLWEGTIKIARANPLFGTGPGTWEWMYPRYRSPAGGGRPQFAHSDILQLVSDYGLVGAALILAVVCCLFCRVTRIVRDAHEPEQRAFALGTAGAVVGLLVHSFFDFSLHIPGNALTLALLFGLTAAVSPHHHGRERRRVPALFKYSLATALVGVIAAVGWLGIRTALAVRSQARGDAARVLYSWDEAREHYFRAIELDPKAPAAHAGLGITYWTEALWLTDPAEDEARRQLALRAVGAFHRAIALNPYESQYFIRLAAAAEVAGDIAGASQAYQRALEVDPHNAFTYYRMGIFSERAGDWPAAVAAYRRAAELGSPDALEWLAQHKIR